MNGAMLVSRQQKTRRSGFFDIRENKLLGTGSNHFDFNAAVFSATFFGLVISHGLRLAFAFCVDTGLVNTFADQIGLDRIGTAHRQFVVVFVRADRVGVADGNDDFKVNGFDLVEQVI